MARQKVELDPAVAAILGDGKKRQRRRGQTRTQRVRAERDGKRQRMTLELDPAVAEMIETIATAEGCSPASVVNLMVTECVAQYVAGGVDFEENRRPSRSPRYRWVVELNGRVEALGEALREFVKSREV